MNPREFMQRWKKGIMNLSEEQRMKAKRNGHLWAVIGGLVGLSFLVYQRIWFFTIFISAIIYLQWIEYRVTRQQLDGFRSMQQEITDQENLRNL